MKKDYMFQYYNSSKKYSIKNTGPTTYSEVIRLFDKYYKEATDSIINGAHVQIAVWCRYTDETDYSTLLIDLNSCNIKVVDNKLYSTKPLRKADFYDYSWCIR